ncbi:twin-arginine translocase TatA/TatE family subunit [uncultured Sunxiuqinia sp.]|jgi:sec-independent protein translocase protein TatA|uniref:twin-arginine translocase TatA/TatE family subunit n=1 Tax=uncultured Sunxiuqinia sp. TaxID=1573825 RepID=UPI0030DC083F|tara:strand:+ start:41035 stop:41247 length:213 start_codon:yes stop_codon:yes gene_type:complete
MYLSIICGMFGPQEIVIILVIVLLLFGGRKIPELMKGFGKGMKEFKKATSEDDDDDDQTSEKKNTEKINK